MLVALESCTGLIDDFKSRGFLPVVGTISVGLKQNPGRSAEQLAAAHKAIRASGKIEEEVWLVDGRNRHTALTELGAEEARWATAIKSLRVTLWTGTTDEKYVSHAEILGIGAVLNASNSMTSSAVSSRGTIRFEHMSVQMRNDKKRLMQGAIDVCAILVLTTDYAAKRIGKAVFQSCHFPVEQYVLGRFTRRHPHAAWICSIAVDNF